MSEELNRQIENLRQNNQKLSELLNVTSTERNVLSQMFNEQAGANIHSRVRVTLLESKNNILIKELNNEKEKLAKMESSFKEQNGKKSARK